MNGFLCSVFFVSALYPRGFIIVTKQNVGETQSFHSIDVGDMVEEQVKNFIRKLTKKFRKGVTNV